MNYLQTHFSEYDCDVYGNVYKNGKQIKPFKSNGYLQVLLFDINHKRKVCGVHTVIAMKYLDYTDGCIVHHKDENKHNNILSNLEVLSREEHSRLHITDKVKYNRLGKTPWNYGKKMDDKYKETCSISAKKRKRKFNGNQYIDMFGNKK